MRCCRGIESGGGGAIHETHHISTALITSTLLPCVSDGFWEVGSGGSALSIPPTYSMFSLSFVTAGLVLLTFCLFMQIGRCSLFSRAGSSFLDSWAPFWKFPRLVSTYRSAAAFSWDPQPEEEEVGKKKANWRRMGEKEADWLERAGQSLLHFVWRMGAKGDGEKSGVKRSVELNRVYLWTWSVGTCTVFDWRMDNTRGVLLMLWDLHSSNSPLARCAILLVSSWQPVTPTVPLVSAAVGPPSSVDTKGSRACGQHCTCIACKHYARGLY